MGPEATVKDSDWEMNNVLSFALALVLWFLGDGAVVGRRIELFLCTSHWHGVGSRRRR
jgi:hypothetical protein